jgi:phage antirepressor YoqD-like protein
MSDENRIIDLESALKRSNDVLAIVTEQMRAVTELLEKKNEMAEIGEALVADRGMLSMTECGKLATELIGEKIGRTIGRNIFCRYMRDLGIFRTNNEPYQRHIDSGQFSIRLKETGVGFVVVPFASKKGFLYGCKKILEYHGYE